MRELVFLWEEHAQTWAKAMIDHPRAIKTAVDTARQAGQSALTAAELDCFHARYVQIVETGYAQNPAPKPPNGPKRRGRLKQSKADNLLDRFRDHPGGILAFMRDFAVPFDKNLFERDLQMNKPRRKISGAFRGIDALHRVFPGDPFVPAVNTG